MCDLSVIVPVYNESDNIVLLCENIQKSFEGIYDSYEVILVDDGSNDGSREIIEQICKKKQKFRFIFFDKNYGQSSALACGFSNALGEIIVTMDADLQVDARDIPSLLEMLKESDFVCGYRQKRADSWIKKVSSLVANSVRCLFTRDGVKDTGCPLKAFKREVLAKIFFFNGMHRFFPTLVRMEGFSISEIPVHHYERKFGKSKYNIRNRLFRSIFDLIGIIWLKKKHLRYKIESQK
jgi:glycosyltransferase involved in cell wall biosynthesis